MSETNSDDDGFHPKQIFDTIRGPNYDTSGISTETEATVVGFGSDLIFTPIVGGHLNFSSPTEDDSEYPVKKTFSRISLPVTSPLHPLRHRRHSSASF